MNVLEMALMGGLLAGTHTLGHLDVARENGVPTESSGLTELYNLDGTDSRTRARLFGEGFRRQDLFNSAVDSKESSMANALYKISYLAGLPQMIDKKIDRGDIEDVDGETGGFTKEIIAMTVLGDLLNASGRLKTKMLFTQNQNGTPMLQFRRKF